jgi:hypothetical protein
MERRCQGPGILESDCANVIAALKTKEGTRSSLWSVLAEAKAIMRGRPDFELSRINRVSNVVAHTLAQLGKCESGFLDEAGPPCVASLLVKDCKNYSSG